MTETRPPIIFLVGPTAIGKTELALLIARQINAEIISCDSMQVYQGMDVLTAKPTLEQRKAVRHHLIDIYPLDKEHNAALFRQMALEAIEGILGRAKTPLLVGGSGMYVKVLVDGIFPDVGKDDSLRRKLEQIAAEKGAGFLYAKLQEIDPEICGVIHPNNLRRIIRALEVYELTKEKMSALQKRVTGLSAQYAARIFGVTKNQLALYKRIDCRVDEMFKQGLVEEVKRLMGMKLSITAQQALGYKETRNYLDGEITLDGAKDLLKKNSRHFAKRQMTWFRKDKRIEWFNLDDLSLAAVAERIIAAIKVESRERKTLGAMK